MTQYLHPPAPCRASPFRLACQGLLLGLAIPVEAANDYYVKPSGTGGDGSSPALAAVFNVNTINTTKLGGVSAPTDLTIWFLPGEYVITQTLGIAGTVQGAPPTPSPTRLVRLKGYVGPGTIYPNTPRPVLRLGTIQDTSTWGIQPPHRSKRRSHHRGPPLPGAEPT